MEYERRLSRWIGLGVLYEFVFGQQKREMVFGLPLSVHAVGGLRLVAAPLSELVEKRELEEKEFEGGVRFGAYYVDESL